MEVSVDLPIQERLGIARNVLADRLSRLVDDGILDREYQERPQRFEYRLTSKGVSPSPGARRHEVGLLPPRARRERPAPDGSPQGLRRRSTHDRLLCVRRGGPVTALNAEATQPVPSAG